jgi:hypothetical protein
MAACSWCHRVALFREVTPHTGVEVKACRRHLPKMRSVMQTSMKFHDATSADVCKQRKFYDRWDTTSKNSRFRRS